MRRLLMALIAISFAVTFGQDVRVLETPPVYDAQCDSRLTPMYRVKMTDAVWICDGNQHATNGVGRWRPAARAATVQYNVEDYGAVANDGADDRAAVQLAVDAACTAGGGVVYFPPGVFTFESINPGTTNESISVVSCDNLVIRGSGRKVTTLQGGEASLDAGDNTKTIINITDSQYFTLEDVTLDGDLNNDGLNWDNGFRGSNVDFSRFRNGNAFDFENHAGALRPNQTEPGSECSDYNWIDNWYSVDANFIVFATQNTETGTGPHDCRNIGNQLTNMKISEFATNCIELRGSDHTLIADSEFWGCRDGINLEEGSAYNIISNVHVHDGDKCTGSNVCSGVKTTCNNFADACGGGNATCTALDVPYFCCTGNQTGTCDVDELDVRPHDNLITGSVFESNGVFLCDDGVTDVCLGGPKAGANTCTSGACVGGVHAGDLCSVAADCGCDENWECGFGQGVKNDGGLRLTITNSVFRGNGLNGYQDENEWSDDTIISDCVFDGNMRHGLQIEGDGTRIIGGSATNNMQKGITILDNASGLEIGGFKAQNNDAGASNTDCTGDGAPFACCSASGAGSCDDEDIGSVNTFITKQYFIRDSSHGLNYAHGPGAYRENTFVPILEAPHVSRTNQAGALVSDITTRSAAMGSGSVLETNNQFDRFFDLRLNDFAERSAAALKLRARVKCTADGGSPVDCLLRWRIGGPFVGGLDATIAAADVGTWQELSQTVNVADILNTTNDTCDTVGTGKCTGGGAWDSIGGFWAKSGTAIEQIDCVVDGGACNDGSTLCCASGPNAGLEDESNTCTVATVDADCRVCTADDQCQHALYGLRLQGTDDTVRVDGYLIESIEGGGSTLWVESIGNTLAKPITSTIDWTCVSGTASGEPCFGSKTAAKLWTDYNQDQDPDMEWYASAIGTGTSTYELSNCYDDAQTTGTCNEREEMLILKGVEVATEQLQITNAVSGGSVELSVQGTGSGGNMTFRPRVAGSHVTVKDPAGAIVTRNKATADPDGLSGGDVNYLEFRNDDESDTSDTGPTIAALGNGTNIDVRIAPKGSGSLIVLGDGTGAGFTGDGTNDPWFDPGGAGRKACIGDRTNGLCVTETGSGVTFQGASKLLKKEVCGGINLGSVAADEIFTQKALYEMTVTDIHCVTDTGTVTVTMEECGSAASCVGAPVVEAAITCDSNGAQDNGTIDNPVINVNNWINWVIGTPTGATELAVVFYCTYEVGP